MDAATSLQRAPRSTRQVVVLTAGSILLGLLVIGVIATVIVLFNNKSNQIHKLQKQVASLSTQVGTLRSQAQSAFTRGMNAQTANDKAFGTTYKDGFKAGIQSVFGGFATPWVDGSWYFVKIDHGTNGGHTISSRAPVTPCQLMYVSGNNLFTENQKGC